MNKENEQITANENQKTPRFDEKALERLEEKTRRFMNFNDYQPIKSRLW